MCDVFFVTSDQRVGYFGVPWSEGGLFLCFLIRGWAIFVITHQRVGLFLWLLIRGWAIFVITHQRVGYFCDHSSEGRLFLRLLIRGLAILWSLIRGWAILWPLISQWCFVVFLYQLVVCICDPASKGDSFVIPDKTLVLL